MPTVYRRAAHETTNLLAAIRVHGTRSKTEQTCGQETEERTPPKNVLHERKIVQMIKLSRILAAMTKTRLAVVVGLTSLTLLGAVVYAATPTPLGVAHNVNSTVVGGPVTLTARKLVIPAGEIGGWHYHPGIITAVVTRGTVTVEDGCGGGETFTVGQGFEKGDRRVHRAINPGTDEEEEYNMFIMPEGNPITVNIPGNQRLCGPALYVEECQNGGWTNFNFPNTFNSQGECVSFVAAAK